MYARSTRRSKQSITRESYLQQDQTTVFEGPESMMQSQQYPPVFPQDLKEASMTKKEIESYEKTMEKVSFDNNDC